jgi:PAS domain S-box-containing protein
VKREKNTTMKRLFRTKQQLLDENILLRQRLQKLEQSEARRKLAEEALRKSEERFRTIFNNSPMAIELYDHDGVMIDINQRACEIFGSTPETCIEKVTLHDNPHYQPPDMWEQLDKGREIRHMIASSMETATNENEKTGRRYYDMITTPVKHISPAIGYFTHIIDVTEHELSRIQFREEKEFLNAIVDTNQTIIVGLDKQHLIRIFSKGAEKITGYAKAEVIGKDWCALFLGFENQKTLDITWKAAWEQDYKAFLRSLENRDKHDITWDPLHEDNTYTVTGPLQIRDGTIKTILWQNTKIYTGDDESRHLHISIGVDITDRKLAEEALRNLEAKQSAMISNISDVIGIIGTDGTIKYQSPSLEKWFGWQPQDLVGTDGGLMVHPDDLERIQKEFNTLIKKDNSSTTVEYRYKCKDGSYKPIELTATNLINDPVIDGILLNYQDITERKQAEKEKEKLQAQLTQAQKMESVGRLAGGVAHDFNNMLQVILGHADMILDGTDPAQPLYAGLQSIRKAARSSADLTRQLLAFARKQTVAPKVLDLNRTLKGMLRMLRRLIGEDIDLTWLPGKDLGSVCMDPSQIDQMVANLCVNARDAIADTGKITIETGMAVFDEDYCSEHAGFVPGEFVRLTVSDDGCGMRKETLPHIFEPFFTTKELGKGTGLGLATIYGIVKQNNGFVNVYSEPGQGTTFNIYLPRHIGDTGQIQEEGLKKPDVRGHETILLVEDEPPLLGMTTMMLERLGYTVVAAGTPGEAIRLSEEYAGQIHLLMTDVVMPEINGRDLAKNLVSSYPNLKCLFMSGYTANVIAHHGVLDEGVNFIQKPFSKKDLSVKLREIMEKE